MEKSPQKFTKTLRDKRQHIKIEKKNINKLKESLLNDAKKVLKILAMQAMKLPRPPPLPLVLLQDLVILIYMALAILAIVVCVFSACN